MRVSVELEIPILLLYVETRTKFIISNWNLMFTWEDVYASPSTPLGWL